ncbi:MAG: hypothetical protein HYR60_09225 [Acidobacteria bacterium]|nr:hypothetical protein [Acidobacteriota bacterium]
MVAQLTVRWTTLFLAAATAYAEILSFGLKAGTPATDAFHAASRGDLRYFSRTKPVTAGPALEVHLPHRTGIEVNLLYRRLNYDGFLGAFYPTRASQWEFPILLTHRLTGGPVRPYLAAGLSFDRLSGIKQVINCATLSSSCRGGETDTPAELRKRSTAGLILGGGLELKTPVVRVSAELRYTRRGSAHFQDPGGLLRSNQNQVELLAGIMF